MIGAMVSGSAIVAEGTRARMAEEIERTLGPFDPKLLEALVAVPRERFIPEGEEARSLEDAPLPLDRSGLANMSAPHAYLLSFRLAGLSSGDSLVELGTGSGYGAALAARIVGPGGHVLTIEIDPDLAKRSKELLLGLAHVDVLLADAMDSAPMWAPAKKVICTFAVRALHDEWLAALPEDGILVAPLGAFDRDQRLVRVVRSGGRFTATDHGGVRYVANRSPHAT
jgi:protein-L-isoaspartate(D-aspartate) O-methyltransferase